MSDIKQNRQQWDALARRSGPSWSKLHVGQHGSSLSAIESQFRIELEQFLQSLQVFKTSISLHGAYAHTATRLPFTLSRRRIKHHKTLGALAEML